MANLSKHSVTTGINLHEMKGVSSAADDTVATALTSATTYRKVPISSLDTTLTAFSNNLFHVAYTEASGVPPVNNQAIVGTQKWVVHPLNTTYTNEISGASLVSNKIRLPAGSYICRITAGIGSWNAVPFAVGSIVLTNTTNSTHLIISSSGVGIGSLVFISSRFTLSGTSDLELRGWTNATNSPVMAGSASRTFFNPPNLGVDNVWSEVLCWKVA